MVEQAGALPGEAETSQADSRAQFVASLGRRLEALRQALFALEQAPKSAALRDHLRRRIHAFGAAAGVLGFDRVFEAFREAESVLGRSGAVSLGPNEFALVARTVDLVPSLVLVAGAPVGRRRDAAAGPNLERRGGVWPTSVLVFGGALLAESLEAAPGAGGRTIECERTEDVERAEEIVRVLAPDVAVIDADRKGARELMETLVYDPLLDPVRIIAVGTFDRPEAAAGLVALGVARVLPKPVGPESLKRSVLEVSGERSGPVQRIEPVGEVTIEALGERIAHEIRRGLVDAVKAQSRGAAVPFGDGTDVLAAVWSSVARIREIATLRSGGAVRFDATGPEGAVPLAPWMGEERPRGVGRGEARSAEGVSLTGRTIVVVDDDPAVVWFLSGLLRAAGAEVLEAHDGARALELVRASWPDLVVSDILMPGLDGFALCREIKRDVALSDTPVILLSWKEDLLQRVRELGADADGYLRKEATASAVVQRVREVLLPRARVEARVAAGGDARGRLDGLTPRLVLELVCRSGGDARITMRDAAFLYEVDVRGGRVRTATRTTPDGLFERGPRALSALLGVRAGRFAVRRDDSPCPRDWDADLHELLQDHVERVRAAQRVLGDLGSVARVEIDEAAIQPYLAATPQSAGVIVRRLAEGVAPSAVVAAGASARLLESVLVDVVLHGAVTRLVGHAGEDLLAREVTSARERRAASSLSSARLAGAPAPALATTPPVAPAEVLLPPVAEAAVAPIAERVVPEIAPAPAAPRYDATVLAPPAPAPAPAALEPEPDASVAALATPPAVPAVPVAVEGAIEPDAVAVVIAPPPMVLAPPAVEAAPERDLEFTALLADSIAPPVPGRDVPRSLQKGLAPPTSAPAELSPLELALRSVPAPGSARARLDESPRAEPVESPHGVVALAASPVSPPPAPATSAALARTEVQPPRSLPPRPEPRKSSVEPSPALDLGDAVLSALADEPASGAEPSLPAPATTRREGSSSRPAPAEPVGERLPEPAPTKREGSHRSSAAATDAKGAPSSKKSQQQPPSAKAPPAAESGGYLGILVVVAVAAAASFALVSALRNGEPPAPAAAKLAEPAPAEPAPSAVPVGAPTGAVRTPPSPSASLSLEDLDLPTGLTVAPDRGLLELDLGTPLSISVDGVFVGHGPLRQVPLREGQHEVRVQGDGVELVRSVDIRKGRRAHLGVTSPR